MKQRRRIAGLAALALFLALVLLFGWRLSAESPPGPSAAPDPGAPPFARTRSVPSPTPDPAHDEALHPVADERLRIWLHDPRWVWRMQWMDPEPYEGFEPPGLESSGRTGALVTALRANDGSTLAEHLDQPSDGDDPGEAAAELMARLALAREEHHRRWRAAIVDTLGPGETWPSIGAEARERAYREGRVPRGLACAPLEDEITYLLARHGDDPYIEDLAASSR